MWSHINRVHLIITGRYELKNEHTSEIIPYCSNKCTEKWLHKDRLMGYGHNSYYLVWHRIINIKKYMEPGRNSVQK